MSLSSAVLGRSGGPERHAELREQRAPFFVRLRRRHEADVETLDRIDTVVVDLGENDLLAKAERVVAFAVERLAGDALEVPHTGERDGDDAIQKLPHAG